MAHLAPAPNGTAPTDNSHESSANAPTDFPQFMRLPVELRFRIWDAISPNLKHGGRVLNVFVDLIEPDDASEPYPWPGELLDFQTESARMMLSTHHESREHALKMYPHSFPIIDGEYCVRFHRDRDIISLRVNSTTPDYTPAKAPYARAFCKEIVNLAVQPYMVGDGPEHDEPDHLGFDLFLISGFPNLKNVFTYDYSRSTEPARIKEKWIETDHTNWFKNFGIIYCWHKTDIPCQADGGCKPLADFALCQPLAPEDYIYHREFRPAPHLHMREQLATITKWPLKMFYVPGPPHQRDGHVDIVEATPGSSGLKILGNPPLQAAWETMDEEDDDVYWDSNDDSYPDSYDEDFDIDEDFGDDDEAGDDAENVADSDAAPHPSKPAQG